MTFPGSFKDYLLADQQHILSVSFSVDRLKRSFGGVGGNIAYTTKLLGADPLLVSVLGKDGDDYLQYLKKLGINTEYITKDADRFTATAYITTDRDANQITAFYNGPLDLGKDFSIQTIKNKVAVALVTVNERATMVKHIAECKQLGMKTIFDPGQQLSALTAEELQQMMQCADFVVGNDYEMKLIQERTGWSESKILEQCEVVITTLGERGSLIEQKGKEKMLVDACKPSKIDDPTGAGDAYRAGFFVGYEKGFDLKTCAQMGSTAASYVVEKTGTQEHYFTVQEFCERYKNAYKESLVLV